MLSNGVTPVLANALFVAEFANAIYFSTLAIFTIALHWDKVTCLSEQGEFTEPTQKQELANSLPSLTCSRSVVVLASVFVFFMPPTTLLISFWTSVTFYV
jgi:hypothetical protein